MGIAGGVGLCDSWRVSAVGVVTESVTESVTAESDAHVPGWTRGYTELHVRYRIASTCVRAVWRESERKAR